MLFYVQMKWNYQGRLTQDQLWEMERKEGIHAMKGVRAGMVTLYKVVSQHRIIAIVNADSLEDLDRNSMGWLPMREYLEFEHVWALRDYEGFLEDVTAKFPLPSSASPAVAAPAKPLSPAEVAEAWFSNMASGNFPNALALLDDDVDWRNIPSTPGVSDVAPWLGSYTGVPSVLKSFDVWAAHSRMLSFTPEKLVVQGNEAIAIVHEHAQCLANQNEYDLYVATNLTIEKGKIKKWQVYWDPSPLIAAYPRR
jgi:muconolactone D-isomerase